MSILIVAYCIGTIVTLLTYNALYESNIPAFEIALTWFYQLPLMVQQHIKHLRLEKERTVIKAKHWSNEFFKATKLANEENWTDEDWKRWHDNIDNIIK